MGKDASADNKGDHSQVREARGKGFVPSLLRGDPQHGPEDLHIGQHNEHKTPKEKTGTNHKKVNFLEVAFVQVSLRMWGISQKNWCRTLPWQSGRENVLAVCSTA